MTFRARRVFGPIPVLCAFIALAAGCLFGQAENYEGKTVARILFVPREQPLDPEEIFRILPVREKEPPEIMFEE